MMRGTVDNVPGTYLVPKIERIPRFVRCVCFVVRFFHYEAQNVLKVTRRHAELASEVKRLRSGSNRGSLVAIKKALIVRLFAVF